jgi:hypothetical protein
VRGLRLVRNLAPSGAGGEAMTASDRHREEARAFLAEYCTDERAGEHNVWDSECERLARVLAAAEQRGVAAGLRAAADYVSDACSDGDNVAAGVLALEVKP